MQLKHGETPSPKWLYDLITLVQILFSATPIYSPVGGNHMDRAVCTDALSRLSEILLSLGDARLQLKSTGVLSYLRTNFRK